MNPIIEPLAHHHDRSHFDCGIESLNRYLKQQASQDARRGFATPFVLVAEGQSTVLGYYTLSMTSVVLEDFAEEISQKIPKYPRVPAILLGRLAVDQTLHKQGRGKYLLFDALHRCLEFVPAWFTVVVDAIDSSAETFYQRYGFQPFPDDKSRLFIQRRTIEQAFHA